MVSFDAHKAVRVQLQWLLLLALGYRLDHQRLLLLLSCRSSSCHTSLVCFQRSIDLFGPVFLTLVPFRKRCL